jgi:hypothetical protein
LKLTLWVLFGIAVIATAPSASATTVVNFDDVTSPPLQLTNQYAASGVVFDQIEMTQSFVFNVIPPSAPNYATPFWNSTNPGRIQFVDPTNPSVLAYTNSVTITMVGLTTSIAHPGNFSGATIDALDLAGNVIAGQTQIVPATNTTTNDVDLTFVGPVHALQFTQAPGTQGILPFDNLTFAALTPIPEPSTAMLLLSAIAGLAMVRPKAASRLK